MADKNRCDSCHAPIRFIRMVSGSFMPLDPEPCEDGNIVINADGEGQTLTKDLFAAPMDGPRYRSHYSTCPQAAKHRKGRK